MIVMRRGEREGRRGPRGCLCVVKGGMGEWCWSCLLLILLAVALGWFGRRP